MRSTSAKVQQPKSPDDAAVGTTPTAAGAEAMTAGTETITPAPTTEQCNPHSNPNELASVGRHHVTSEASLATGGDVVTTSANVAETQSGAEKMAVTAGAVVPTSEVTETLGADYLLVEAVEQYLTDYVKFADPIYVLPMVLFVVLTYCWFECFDVAPHVVITSGTKRSGKTTLMELLSFASARALNISSITVAALWHEINDNHPVLYIDEAESYNNEKSEYRPIINGGYRRGQFVIRMFGRQSVRSTNFCPKVFGLIGDTYDTLRDRTITVVMRRGKAPKEYVYEEAKSAGEELGSSIQNAINPRIAAIKETYASYSTKYNSLSFLTARDREIWKPLFTLCQILCPSRIPELERSAVDIAGYKTQDIRRFTGRLAAEEKEADEIEYGEKLLRDMIRLRQGRTNISTSESVKELRALPTSPWRTYRGPGLTDDRAGAMMMAALLSRYGVEPKTIRVAPRGHPHDTIKGYKFDDLVNAATKFGIAISDAPTVPVSSPGQEPVVAPAPASTPVAATSVLDPKPRTQNDDDQIVTPATKECMVEPEPAKPQPKKQQLGQCPHCRYKVLLRKNGEVGKHRASGTDCPGVGRLPVVAQSQVQRGESAA